MRHIPEILVGDEERASPPQALPVSPFGDIPKFIWTAYLSTWAVLFGLFLIFFAADGPSALAVVTASFFALMLLGLPAAMGSQTRWEESPSKGVIETHTGPVPIGEAAMQMLLIPVGSVIGLVILIIVAIR
jgi:hypothetical protein